MYILINSFVIYVRNKCVSIDNLVYIIIYVGTEYIYIPITLFVAYVGFTETRRGCCGTGKVETAILCNRLSLGTCTNATQYVFFDSVHPSQAANAILATGLLEAGIGLVT